MVRIRTFLLAPEGETNWLIIGEVSNLTGWERLERFRLDGQEFK